VHRNDMRDTLARLLAKLTNRDLVAGPEAETDDEKEPVEFIPDEQDD
jgi:hypothetical protein